MKCGQITSGISGLLVLCLSCATCAVVLNVNSPEDVDNSESAVETSRSATTNVPLTNTPQAQLQVIVNAVNLRSGPGTNYEQIGLVGRDEPLKILAKNNNGSWYNVELEDGSIGWIADSVTKLVDEATSKRSHSCHHSSLACCYVPYSNSCQSTNSPTPSSAPSKLPSIVSHSLYTATATRFELWQHSI